METKFWNNEIISIDNALVNAAQGLLLSEKRIIMFAITQLSEQKNLEKYIKIEALDYSKLYNLEPKTAYEQIRDACEGIIKKQVSWYEKGKTGLEKTSINWISYAKYFSGMGFVKISFTEEIKKYILNLSNHFTTYQLQYARALRSNYSWRLLEILSQFKSTGWREIEINKFAEIMEATSKQKKDFYEIRRKIIEPSVKELSEKGEWEIKWKTFKKGRKITHINFKFKKK